MLKTFGREGLPPIQPVETYESELNQVLGCDRWWGMNVEGVGSGPDKRVPVLVATTRYSL